MSLRRVLVYFISAAFGLAVFAWMFGTETERVREDGDASAVAPLPTVAAGVEHHGIDVSYHSGHVDWLSVAAEGFTFAFAKATEGVDFHDTSFASHWGAMKTAGLVRGAYHFYVTEDDPDSQAQWFTSIVTLEPGDLAPVVDIEVIGHGTMPGLRERFQRFLTLIEEHYGAPPIIYTSPHFWNEHLSDGFGGYPLWVAEYQVSEPRVPMGWDTWHLWQWAGDTLVAGVEKSADITRLNRNAVRLEELLVGVASSGSRAASL